MANSLKHLEHLKRISKLGAIRAGEVTKEKFRKLYEQNPKYCKHCKQIIPYDHRTFSKQFCNSSCSATYNNSKRKHSPETKEKIKKTLKDNHPCKIHHLTCAFCKKEFIQSNGRRPKKNCSPECYKAYNRVILNRVSVNKRSQNEIMFFELCKKEFNDVKPNHLFFMGWDVDVMINDKIAVLWNGIWHYKQLPIKGHNLKQIKARDTFKLKKLNELGFIPYIIKDMGWPDEKLVKREFKKFKKWFYSIDFNKK